MATRNNLSGIILRHKAEDASAGLPPLMLAAERVAGAVLHGEHRRKRAGQGEQFWQFREYMTGDRPQDIDWRLSGRTDRIFIRQKEWQTNQQALLWCAQGPNMDFHSEDSLPTKRETARIITLALAILLTHAGETIALPGMGQGGRTEKTLQTIGDFLLNAHDTAALPPADIDRYKFLFLCGDFLEPAADIEKSFTALADRGRGGCVVQILDPAEIALPYEGRIRFESADGTHREMLENAASVQAAYRQRILNHLEAVREICRACGWQYALHDTARPLSDTLLKVWEALGPLAQRRETGRQ